MLISLAFYSIAAAFQASDSVATRLQSIADSVVRTRSRIPSVALYVHDTRSGKEWSIAAGQSDTARDVALKPNQPMRVASVTKTYTAAAILRLVEKGTIKLSDPLSKHLPREFAVELQRDGIKVDSITIEQMLGHRSGLNEHTTGSYIGTALANPSKRWTRMEQVKWLVDSLQPVGPPGAQFKYSDTGYVLLGAIVERYTGKNLGAGIRELLDYDKLGLRQTWFETLEPAPSGVADRIHQYMSGVDTYGTDPSVDLYGGGGIVAPLSDIAKFFTALVNGRVLEKRATLDTMMVMRPGIQGMMEGYGLGIFRINSGGRRGYGHSGFWGVAVAHYPAEGITIAAAVNEQSVANSVFGIMTAALNTVRPH